MIRQKTKFKFEIIVIDDNSNDSINLDKGIKNILNIKIINLNKRVGAAGARNIGISMSRHELIVFLDADMIVPKNFIQQHVRLHQKYKRIISVGFRKHIFCRKKGNLKINVNRAPSYKSDFRYKKYIPHSWQSQYPKEGISTFNRTHYPLRETSDFSKFGHRAKIGVWELPHMVLTCSMGVRKNWLFKVGGFTEKFKKSWYEDTFLGAQLIAIGLKVIPIKNITGYHIVKNNSGKRLYEFETIKQNRDIYLKLINKPIINKNHKEFIKMVNNKYGRYIRKLS